MDKYYIIILLFFCIFIYIITFYTYSSFRDYSDEIPIYFNNIEPGYAISKESIFIKGNKGIKGKDGQDLIIYNASDESIDEFIKTQLD